MKVLFSSIQGGWALRGHILEQIAFAGCMVGKKVELQVMCFALTDESIAKALLQVARNNPNLTLRVIADWSQSAKSGPSQICELIAQAPPNLHVKFKLDLPYERDAKGDLRYSYKASFGMLHHKSLCFVVDGQPFSLTIGSMNWSKRALQAYENVLTLDIPADPNEQEVRDAFHAEFEALWKDHAFTATQHRADLIMQQFRSSVDKGPVSPDIACLRYFGTEPGRQRGTKTKRKLASGDWHVAFSARAPGDAAPCGGCAQRNDRRSINLLRSSGTRCPAPMNLTTLTLEAIRSVPDEGHAFLAMYALSPRHPALGALLQKARAGCKIDVILDGRLGQRTAQLLRNCASIEGLALSVKTTRRQMHQKYFCCPDIGLTLTGTANMTSDATTRHADHALLIRSDVEVANAFARDFECIWDRLPAPETGPDRQLDGAGVP